jgi:hypothetical protein
MGRFRVRFEPIDIVVDDPDKFYDEYSNAKEIIKASVSQEFSEHIPDIRKIYPIDEEGFPIQ